MGMAEKTSIIIDRPSSKSWIKAGELPTGRLACTCTVLPSGEVFVAGGVGTERRVDIALVQN